MAVEAKGFTWHPHNPTPPLPPKYSVTAEGKLPVLFWKSRNLNKKATSSKRPEGKNKMCTFLFSVLPHMQGGWGGPGMMGPGMMGPGMMGPGMMGPGMMGPGMMGPMGMMGPGWMGGPRPLMGGPMMGPGWMGPQGIPGPQGLMARAQGMGGPGMGGPGFGGPGMGGPGMGGPGMGGPMGGPGVERPPGVDSPSSFGSDNGMMGPGPIGPNALMESKNII